MLDFACRGLVVLAPESLGIPADVHARVYAQEKAVHDTGVRVTPANVPAVLELLNAPGLIDAGYRGEIRVLLLNTDRESRFAIEPGDRIAQLLVVAFSAARPLEVAELSDFARGDGGFGSTGTGSR